MGKYVTFCINCGSACNSDEPHPDGCRWCRVKPARKKKPPIPTPKVVRVERPELIEKKQDTEKSEQRYTVHAPSGMPIGY